jgi:hypothetical protein
MTTIPEPLLKIGYNILFTAGFALTWPYFTYLITAVHQGLAGRTTAWVLDEADGQFIEQVVEVVPDLQGVRNN